MFKTEPGNPNAKTHPSRIASRAMSTSFSASTPYDATSIIEAAKKKTTAKRARVLRTIKTEIDEEETEEEEMEPRPSTSRTAAMMLPKKRPYVEEP